MELFADAMSGVGVVLLPVAAGLLLEELTFGGWSGCCWLHDREPKAVCAEENACRVRPPCADAASP
jgi:hypothetical protein